MMAGPYGSQERECFLLMKSWPFSFTDVYGRVTPFPGGLQMRRLSGLLLAGAIMLLPAFSQGHDGALAQAAQAAPAFTFDGDVALWTLAIKPDKTADFETIMAKVREALLKSEKPERKAQAAGWKVVKDVKPLPDGNIRYTQIGRASCRESVEDAVG